MIKKIVTCLVICGCLFGGVPSYAGLSKSPTVTKKASPKPGDILAVEVSIEGKLQIILVYVNFDGSMEYVYNGKVYPFPAADLNEYQWAYYVNTSA